MKNRLFKLACLFTLLAVVLTGCSLIEVDPIMQLNEDMDALKADYANVVVTYDGGQVTKGDLMADYAYQYSYLTYMYMYYYGSSITEDDAYYIAESVASGYINTYAVLKKAEELGVTLTEEEIAECVEYAQTNYQEDYDTAYASAEGETEEERKLATEYTLASQGISYDYYYHQYEWDLIITKVEEIVMAEAPALTEDEIKTRLAAQAMDDEAAYSQDSSSYEQNKVEGTLITWNPSGYRTVKHILLIPETEILDAYIAVRNDITTANNELATLNNERLEAKNGNGERSLEEVEADLEAKKIELDELEIKKAEAEAACVANVQAKLDEVYGKLEAGEDFAAVMTEYGEDPGMTADPSMTEGYYVCATSETWDHSFRNAAMDLEKVGDYSAEPVVSASGVHIIYYNADVEAGAVELDDIREEYTVMAQEEANQDYYNEQLAAWVADMNAKYNIDNFFANED